MTNRSFFYDSEVEIGCKNFIKERFKVLFDTKKIIQQNLADHLSFDKAYISRIVNGLEIPPHPVRIKIASYFGVDSTSIWRLDDIEYISYLLQKIKTNVELNIPKSLGSDAYNSQNKLETHPIDATNE